MYYLVINLVIQKFIIKFLKILNFVVVFTCNFSNKFDKEKRLHVCVKYTIE